MTGAPKIRSVALLERLESNLDGDPLIPPPPHSGRRGIYSGVAGWIGLSSTLHLSVIIRTVIQHGQDLGLGAGGAITYLSNPHDEYEEMLLKARSILTW